MLQLPSWPRLLKAVQDEASSGQTRLQLSVLSSRREGNAIRVSLNPTDPNLDRLDDSLEGWLAVWQNQGGKKGSAVVLTENRAEDELALRHTQDPLPAPESRITLYSPNFQSSLSDVYSRPEAPGFLDRFQQKLTARPLARSLEPAPGSRLRTSQRNAFRLAAWPAAFLWGPPGTGKTETLSAMLARLLETHPSQRILVLSSMNPAVDDLLLRTDDHLARSASRHAQSLRQSLRRIGSRFDIRRYSGHEHLLAKDTTDAQIELTILEADPPPKSDLAAYTRFSDRRADLRRKLNHDLSDSLRHARLLGMTTNRALLGFDYLRNTGAFDWIVFDESSQIPLPVALALADLGQSVLFAGDPQQLAPISRTDNPLFAASPFSVPHQAEREVFLEEQSRMPAAISKVISQCFYQGRLRVAVDAEQNRQWLNDRKPIPIGGLPARHAYHIRAEGPSEFNQYRKHHRKSSVAVTLEIVRHLLQRNIDPSRILILAPFRSQASLYREEIRKARLGRIICSTVHRAQGSEVDTVFFDATNANSAFLNDHESAPRLVNVALSRARCRLFLIATSSDLENPLIRKIASAIGAPLSLSGDAPEDLPHLKPFLENPETLPSYLGRRFLCPVDSSNVAEPVTLIEFVGDWLTLSPYPAGERFKVGRQTLLNRYAKHKDRIAPARKVVLAQPDSPPAHRFTPLSEYLDKPNWPANIEDEYISFMEGPKGKLLECHVLSISTKRVEVCIYNRNESRTSFSVMKLREWAKLPLATTPPVRSQESPKLAPQEKQKPKPIPTGCISLKVVLAKTDFPSGLTGKTILWGPDHSRQLFVSDTRGKQILVVEEGSRRQRWLTQGALALDYSHAPTTPPTPPASSHPTLTTNLSSGLKGKTITSSSVPLRQLQVITTHGTHLLIHELDTGSQKWIPVQELESTYQVQLSSLFPKSMATSV